MRSYTYAVILSIFFFAIILVPLIFVGVPDTITGYFIEPTGDVEEISDWHDLHDMRNNLDGEYVLMNDLTNETEGYSDYNEKEEDYEVTHEKPGSEDWKDGDTVELHFDEEDYGSILSVEDYNDNSINYTKGNNNITLDEDVGDDEVYIKYEDALVGRDPIGNNEIPFTGTICGQQNKIEDWVIDRPSEDYIGLFGSTDNANIQNIGLSNVDVTGGDYVGVLVGENDGGFIEKSFVSGGVTGGERAGGIVGYNDDGQIKDCYSRGGRRDEETPDALDLIGRKYVGGVVGHNTGTVENSYSTMATWYLKDPIDTRGGLIGLNDEGAEVIDCPRQDWGRRAIGKNNGQKVGRVVGAPEEDMQDIRLYTEDDFGEYPDLNNPWNITKLEEWDGETWVIDGEGNISDGLPFFLWIEEYELEVDVKGEGTTDPQTGNHTYIEGEEVDIEANPDGGWYFDEWTGDVDGIEDPKSPNTKITMNDDYSITAEFEIDRHELKVDSGDHGQVTNPGEGTYEYDYGTVVALEAEADEGYDFVEWTGDVENIEDTDSASTTVTMEDNYTIKAGFEISEYDLTVDSTDGGEIVKPEDETTTHKHGTVVALEAEVDDNYHFVGWSGGNNIEDRGSPSTTVTMEGDYSVTAEFEIDQYELTVDSIDGGEVVEPGEGTYEYDYGTVVELKAEADEGYEFSGWIGSINSKNIEETITMTEDREVLAYFSWTYCVIRICGPGNVCDEVTVMC